MMFFIRRGIAVIFVLLMCFGISSAQIEYNLEECIDYAIQNNLPLQQFNNEIRRNQLDRQLAQESRFPSLSINTTFGSSFGRTIDPTTNTFVASTLLTNGISLNTGFVIFDGNRINNTVAQARINTLAATKDRDQALNDLALNVAQAYLNVLLAYDNRDAAVANLDLTKAQLTQTEKLVSAGSLPKADLYEVQSQVARNEQELVSAENNIVLGLLQLKQLMFFDPNIELKIVRPDIDIEESDILLRSVDLYNAALQTQPQIDAGELRVQSARKSESIARTGYYPTLSTFAQLFTNYSSLARDIAGITTVLTPPTPVIIDGETRIIQLPQQVPQFVDQPYFNQLDRNLGVGLGVQLSIPLYSNGRTRLGTEQAKLNSYNANIQLEQTKQQLKNDVERALAEAKASRQNYNAAQKAFVAAERVLSDAEKRLAAGSINSFDFTNAKTRYDSAVISRLIAKYEYVFRLKVLDFYMGKPLTL